MKKSEKKTALIPYLDNIEITSIAKMLIKLDFLGVLVVFVVEQDFIFDTILGGVKQQERKWGFSFLNFFGKEFH